MNKNYAKSFLLGYGFVAFILWSAKLIILGAAAIREEIKES